jgi:hypothetical protein
LYTRSAQEGRILDAERWPFRESAQGLVLFAIGGITKNFDEGRRADPPLLRETLRRAIFLGRSARISNRPRQKEELTLIRLKSLMFSLLLLGAVLVASQSARAAEPPAQSLEDHLKATREDIRARRESAIRTLVSLDEAQAKVFWPLKSQYDAELKTNGEAREALLREYAKVYQKITPSQAQALGVRSLKLDEDRNALRRKYFDLMSEKVSPVAAAQFLQIERQHETMMDLEVQKIVPLAGL